jgi:hypothetical protein
MPKGTATSLNTEGIGVGFGRTDNRIKLIPQAQAIGFY